MKMLVVDDSRAMRAYLRALASQLSFTSEEAEDGRAALDLLIQNDPREPFDIALVRAELWHAPRGTPAVLRAAPSPALTALRQHTTELAAQAGLPPERRPWKPHLTALRQAEQVQTRPLAAPIRWQVDQVALIWSDLQAQPPRYHRLGAFPGG